MGISSSYIGSGIKFAPIVNPTSSVVQFPIDQRKKKETDNVEAEIVQKTRRNNSKSKDGQNSCSNKG